jgi:alpha/beta hydrolase fold
VEYPNSPEARYPTAIEQGYATAQWITRDGASKGLDASRNGEPELYAFQFRPATTGSALLRPPRALPAGCSRRA